VLFWITVFGKLDYVSLCHLCLVGILVLLSQDLPSPFVLVRFARIFLPKRYSVQSRA